MKPLFYVSVVVLCFILWVLRHMYILYDPRYLEDGLGMRYHALQAAENNKNYLSDPSRISDGAFRRFQQRVNDEKKRKSLKQMTPYASIDTEHALNRLTLVRDGHCDHVSLAEPIPVDFINLLMALSTSSSFGYAENLVQDSKIRMAYELQGSRFQVWGKDGMIANGNAQNGWNSVLGTKDIRWELNKLFIYPEGGHFVAHRDSIKSEYHVLNAVVELPSEYETETGGGLELFDDKTQQWQQATRPVKDAAQIAVFSPRTLHRASKVTNGYRVILQLNGFSR